MAELQWAIARQTFEGGPFDLIEQLSPVDARLEYKLYKLNKTPVKLLKREVAPWEVVKETPR